jgi:hypothetical protein
VNGTNITESLGDADKIVEVVAVFTAAQKLQKAIDDLMSSGFDRADLSLLASEKIVDEKLGHGYQSVAELEDEVTVPRSCYIAPESIGDAEGALISIPLYIGALGAAGCILSYGGAVLAAIKGAILGGGAGALVGLGFAKLIGSRHARYLRGQLSHGGLLLWVRTGDIPHIKRAVGILFKNSAAMCMCMRCQQQHKFKSGDDMTR